MSQPPRPSNCSCCSACGTASIWPMSCARCGARAPCCASHGSSPSCCERRVARQFLSFLPLLRRQISLLPLQWLLIEWPADQAEPTNCVLSTLPEDTPLNELVDAARRR